MQTDTAAATDLDTLRDLNRDYIRAVQESDVRRFDALLADDFLCSNPDGSLIDRAAFLQQTTRPVTITNLEAHAVNIRLMGEFAIIHARTTYTGPDGRPGQGATRTCGRAGMGTGSPSRPTSPAANGRRRLRSVIEVVP